MADNKNQKSKSKKQKLGKFKGVPSKKEQQPSLQSRKEVQKAAKNQKENASVSLLKEKIRTNITPRMDIAIQLQKDFPKNFRFITETRTLLVVLTLVFVVSIAVLLLQIQARLVQAQALEQKRSVLQSQIVRWQEVVRKYPGYRDAYFQLALLEYQLGDYQASESYINTIKSLDPNFEKAYQLEKMMEK